jgi:AAA domain
MRAPLQDENPYNESESGEEQQPEKKIQAPSRKEVEDYREDVTNKIIGMLTRKSSICITGEVGIGKTHLAEMVIRHYDNCCYGYYNGDNTECLQEIASDLEIPLYQIKEDGAEGRPLTAKQLKYEIADNLGETVLICDNFHRWPTSLKGWVERLHKRGATIMLLGIHRDLEGVAYKIPRLALSPLKEEEIRDVIWRQAKQLSLALTASEVAEMAGRTGGNPLLAQRMVLEIYQGVESKNIQDGSNYLDITPFLLFIVGLIGTVRFIGMANGDIKLRIFGGIAVTVLFSIRYLGLLFPKGSRK